MQATFSGWHEDDNEKKIEMSFILGLLGLRVDLRIPRNMIDA